jgi:hypothetical protein
MQLARVQNFVILWRVFNVRAARHASSNEAGAAECERHGSIGVRRAAGAQGPMGHPNERDRQEQMGHVLKRYQFRTKLI